MSNTGGKQTSIRLEAQPTALDGQHPPDDVAAHASRIEHDLHGAAYLTCESLSTNRLPKPRRRGSTTGGPPSSRQTISRYSGSSGFVFQLIWTLPVSLLNAPYLMAFVPSSWRASEKERPAFEER